MSIAVIIAAAGSGRRVGAEKNKLLLPLSGRTVLARSLDIFAADAEVGQIIVAAAAADMAEANRICADYAEGGKYAGKLLLAEGGESRQQSISKALAAVDSRCSHIAVHDAARPLLHNNDWQRLKQAAKLCPAAILAAPAVDSIKLVEGGFVQRSLPREQLVLAQTPQLFAADLLRQAYQQAEQCSFAATDDAELVEKLGAKVCVVKAEQENFKLTYAGDFERAEQVLRQRAKGVEA